MKQYEAVIATLERMGGVATLGELNAEVFKIKECKWNTKTPFASIRRIVQTTKGIYKIKPGLYALESRRKELENRGVCAETDKNKGANHLNAFNHAYYQGLLLIIGKYRSMKTCIPQQDKNKTFYDGRKLQELSSLAEQPAYTYPSLLKRSATIDTVWFNCQLLGEATGETARDALNNLLKENEWIIEQGFHLNEGKVIARELADSRRYFF